jgi:hypothetical protein
METHVHDWKALTAWIGRYHCSTCGALGYKRKLYNAVNEKGEPLPWGAVVIIPYICQECGQPAIAKDIILSKRHKVPYKEWRCGDHRGLPTKLA